MIKAKNIQWDFDMEEVFERLDNMPYEKAAEAISIPKTAYANMTTEERHDFAYDLFHHCPAALDEFMGLPNEIEIPPELINDDDISEWLSDEYGFCHHGFELTSDNVPTLKKIICPSCGKELIALEPYKNGKSNFWCDCENITIEINPDEETPVSIYNDNIRVDWYNAGEGVTGDYNPDDPNDINLLRFDVYMNPDLLDIHFDDTKSWEEVDDASYCTQIPANSPIDTLINTLWIIFKRYRDVLESDPYTSVKKMGEELSYISLYENSLNHYFVNYRIDSRYCAEITLPAHLNPKNHIEEIKYSANNCFDEADFGDSFEIDGCIVSIEDEEGNIIWENN